MADETVDTWLVEAVAGYLAVPASQIGTDVRLQALGLDSVHAMALCVDIEDRWGVLVEPTLAWDHPTIDAIAAHLKGQLHRE
ncbi:acyl carrier protein [Allokutzneria sp. NRRL B-24872]|uniref:acyl carrier protein n=1 Tax=Allokutzneria sp. NRRL B-24872 TaxID=1137961 RepID=UPI000A3B1212|nr:acyl carrier protein [Allokutzneria sp. NRRL B-24872]